MSEIIRKIMEEQKKALKIDSSMQGKDKKCPFTGGLKLRGRVFTGILVSKDAHRTAKVEWYAKKFINKYERFMVKKSKVAAHNPEIINAQIGDKVVIAECRPLSKSKKFVIIQNLGHSKEYMIKRASIEEDKKVAEDSKKASTKSEEESENESN
jgi:small subunit ribosomal protein S17